VATQGVASGQGHACVRMPSATRSTAPARHAGSGARCSLCIHAQQVAMLDALAWLWVCLVHKAHGAAGPACGCCCPGMQQQACLCCDPSGQNCMKFEQVISLHH
jgi:hypothetical protein